MPHLRLSPTAILPAVRHREIVDTRRLRRAWREPSRERTAKRGIAAERKIGRARQIEKADDL